MKIIELQQTDSTNSWLSARAGELEGECLVYALSQTAGRGQRGNSWESEPGKNLTASILLHPAGVLPQCQFVISEAVALAVTDFLADLGLHAMVKWPNDIYVGDRKICGILIEHAVMPGVIMRTIAGIGININQRQFVSDAPNPVSVWQLTGNEYEIHSLAEKLAAHVENRMKEVCDGRLHSEFMHKLWRGDGNLYDFYDRNAGEHVSARIKSVAPDGMLTIETASGELRTFAFKEIEFLL